MTRKTWGERFRKAFIANAEMRGFTDVEFRDKVVYCNNGRGGIQPQQMDPKTEILIARWVTKQIEQGKV